MKDRFLYGTAWKREDTASCVLKALKCGFRAIDTACQPRHYREELVGEAIRGAFADGTLTDRSDIWIQTKFTRSEAQDPDACPYDQSASLEEQVHTSIQTSLHHLRHRPDLDAINDDAVYLDCLVLHSPFPLAQFDDTLTVWRTMSSYVPHKVRALGVANLSHEHLVRLYDAVATKPSYVQNRLHAQTGWECPQRQFCQAHGLTFQAHKVLKQKEEMLASDLVGEVAAALGGLSRQTALYLCFLGLGAYMTIVNGTKSEEHMKEDRECLERFEGWIAETNNQVLWERFMAHFKEMIGE